MSSQKCPKCGLVNWANAESCRRCAHALKPRSYEPTTNRAARDFSAPEMSTFNGMGTTLLGWTHHGDGTSTATLWFTFLYLPIIPLRRYTLLSPTSDDFESGASVGQVVAGLGGAARLSTYYRFVGRLPLSGAEVMNTYLYAYVLLPIKLLAPLAVLILVGKMLKAEPGKATQFHFVFAWVYLSLLLAWIGYVLFVLATLLRRSRGGA